MAQKYPFTRANQQSSPIHPEPHHATDILVRCLHAGLAFFALTFVFFSAIVQEIFSWPKALLELTTLPVQKKYSFTRLIVITFLIFSLMTRIILMVYSLNVAEASAAEWLTGIMAGFFSDLVTLSFALIPVALFDCLVSASSRISFIIKSFAFIVITFSLIFLAAAEFTFWQEFGSRFNFIAVDYLIYTQEVIDNIFQSYPVKSLLLLFTLLSMGITFIFSEVIRNTLSLPIKHRLITLSILVISALFSWSFWSPERVAITGNHYSDELAGNGLYNFFSAYRNNELDYISLYPTIDKSTANGILATLRNSDGTSAQIPLTHKPKHVIMITVESLSAEFLGSFGNKNGLTPNLDKLASEGLLFTNLYAVGTRTVRGLEALSLAVPPTPGQSIVRRPDNENLASLGANLDRHGFDSHYLYGGYGYFDNMNYFFSHNGYEVTDRHDVPKEKIGFANAWGMADEFLFSQADDLMDKNASKKSQFLMIMTTSNHRPYTYPDGKIDIPSPGGRSGAVKYTDYAIGKFIQESQLKPWFKDTLFVIVADHCASSAGKTSLPVARYHIPAIFYAPSFIHPAQETRLVSQIDLPPTLLTMLGLPADPHFFGSNVWNNASYTPRAFISNYQELGYLKNNLLVVLAPHKPAKIFKVDINKPDPDQIPELLNPEHNTLIQEAIAYYQTAALNFKQGAMKLSPSEQPLHVLPRQ